LLSSSQKTLLGLGHKNMILEEEVKSQRLRCALHWMLKYHELFASNTYDVTFGLQFLQLQVGNDILLCFASPSSPPGGEDDRGFVPSFSRR